MYRIDLDGNGKDGPLEARSKDYGMAIDIKGMGMTPPDTLLASLAGCIGVYLRKYADGAGLDLGKFRIVTEGELSKEAPFRFETIIARVDTGLKGLDDRRMKALESFLAKCPIHNTLASDVTFKLSVS